MQFGNMLLVIDKFPLGRRLWSTTASNLALAVVATTTMGGEALAEGECGTPQNNVINCDNLNYPTGITYPSANGLTLKIQNPYTQVQGNIVVHAAPNSTQPISVEASTFHSISGYVELMSDTAALTAAIGKGTASSVTTETNTSGNSSVILSGAKLDVNSLPGYNAVFSRTGHTGDASVTIQNAADGTQTTISGEYSFAPGELYLVEALAVDRGDVSVTMNGGSISSNTMSGIFAHNFDQGTGNDAIQVLMTGGTIETPFFSLSADNFDHNGRSKVTINETTAPVSIVGNVSADGGYVDFTMDGGSVTGGTIEQDAIYLSPDTGLKADFNGGVVSATLEGSRAIFAETRSQDQTLTLAGTSVQAIALNSVGLYVEGYPTINGKPAAMTVHMSSGNLAASGASSKAIQTYSRQGPTQLNLNMSGGTIAATGQDSVGLLLHAYASSSAVFYLSNGAMTATGASLFEIENGVSDNDFATTIAAASTMTMDADGASYLINNRNDSAKASMQVSTSGKIKGHAMLGGGGSTFTLSGGSFVGNIYGDYDQLNGQSSDTKNQGVDNFVWTAGILTGDVYTQGGNDTATLVNLTSYNLGEQKITIDGGDGTDTLKLEAGSLTLSNRTLSGGGKVIDLVNWELITMKTGSSASLVGDSLTLNAYDRSEHIAGLSNAHGDLTLSEGSLLFVAPANGNAFSLSANVVLADASSSIVLAPGTETRIYGHVVNSGLIDMRDGLATSTLIIGDGTGLAYSGDSGRIAIDVDFAERKADRIILHGQAEGTTTLSIATVGEKAVGGDIVLAQTAATEAVTFALEGGELKVSGLHAYGLASTTGNGITTIRLADRGYQPYVPLYEAYPSVLLEMSRPSSLDRRAGARYDGGEALTAGPAPAALWGRTAGDFSHIDPESATTGYDYDLSAVQFEAGLDGLLLDSAEGALVGGLTGHYRDGEAKIASPYGASKIHPDGWGLGATLTWFGENGFYADGQALATWYTSELKAEDLPLAPEDSDAFAYAFSAEIGQAFALSDGLSLTPQAQLAFTSVHIDGFTGAYSDKVDFDDGQSLFARLGAKLEKTAAWQDAAGLSRKARLYGAANIGHEFLGKTTATVSDIYAFSSEPDDWAGEIAIGGAIDWQAGKLQYAAFAEITATTGFSTGSYGYGGNLGLKVKF